MKSASCIQVKDWSWLGQQHRPSVRLLLTSQYRKFTRHYPQKSCEEPRSNTNERSTHMSLQQGIRIPSLPAKSPKRQLCLIRRGNSPEQSCSQTTNISTRRENCQSQLLFQTARGQISKRKMLVSRFHKSTQLNELNTSFPSRYYLPRHRSSLLIANQDLQQHI